MKQNLEYVVPIKLYTEPQNDSLAIVFDKNELVTILEEMHEQTKLFAFYYFLNGTLYDVLNDKYGTVPDKWYKYAFVALEQCMELCCEKLINNQSCEFSFYNILRYICCNDNFRRFILQENEDKFRKIICEFNSTLSEDEYKMVKIRRNKIIAHNTECLFNKKDYHISLEVYYKALKFCLNNIPTLYHLIVGKDMLCSPLKGLNIELTKQQSQISEFVHTLDENGELRCKW